MEELKSIAIRLDSEIEVVADVEGMDGTKLKGLVGKVIYILKDIVDEDGICYDSAEVEENDSLDGIGIDVEFEMDCYVVPKGSYKILKV